MDISFLTMLPQFQQLSEEKKQFLIEIEVLKQNMSKEEATRTDKMLKMAQQFLMMQQMKKR